MYIFFAYTATVIHLQMHIFSIGYVNNMFIWWWVGGVGGIPGYIPYSMVIDVHY